MCKLYTDGGARGNPGPSAGAAVLYDDNGVLLEQSSEYYGVSTNNQAEYRALLLGLNSALKKGIKVLSVFLDSELIVKQLNGQYRVKDVSLAAYYNIVKSLEGSFTFVSYTHIPRVLNKEADFLVNKELDSK